MHQCYYPYQYHQYHQYYQLSVLSSLFSLVYHSMFLFLLLLHDSLCHHATIVTLSLPLSLSCGNGSYPHGNNYSVTTHVFHMLISKNKDKQIYLIWHPPNTPDHLLSCFLTKITVETMGNTKLELFIQTAHRIDV